MHKHWMPRIAVVMFAAGLVSAAGPAPAQSFPSKPITIIVPYGPGTGNDVIARIIAQNVTETWGHAMVVENRPGANASIGAELVAKAPPDGYTVLIGSSSSIVNQYTSKDVRYDMVKDFAPVGFCGSLRSVLAVNNDVPAKSMKELAELARARPGKLNYAASSAATRLMAEVFKSAAGIDFQIIDYKLTATGVTDVVSGRVEMVWTTTATIAPLVASGRLRALGITGDGRAAVLPEVPSMAEAGFPALNVNVDFFILAPAGTPKPIVAALNAEIVKSIANKEVRDRLAAAGVDPKSSTPEALGEFIKSDAARWSKMVKDIGFRVE
jgi:tripartite-type tricarboxylate transporter receptor subunit TctC